MKKGRKILLTFPVFLLLFSIVTFGICGLPKPGGGSLYQEMELFTDAITYIRLNYVDEVSAKDLIYGALKGMLASLDPYSQFMDPDSYKDIKADTKGEFGGIGIEISIRDGLLTIISPIEGTPGYKAGLAPYDRIVKIDGESTKNITLIDAVKRLRGKPGKKVTLTILREAEGKIFDVTITRSVIKIDSIKESIMLEDNVGYIRLVEFQERSSKDLNEAITRLKKKGMDSLILDLRNNPGGLLGSAVDVADLLLPEGKVIVTVRGRSKEQEVVYKSKGTFHAKIPLVIMLNGGSASASEIVAGAIQDNGRGLILGTKSFGKGSVQTVIPLKDNSALRLTTAKYFTPSGRTIREEGIVPDVVVDYQELPRKEGITEKVEKVFEKVEKKPNKKVLYDNQLQRALDLLRGIKAYNRMKG